MKKSDKQAARGTQKLLGDGSGQAQLPLMGICVRAALLAARSSLVEATRELLNALGAGLPNYDPNQLSIELMKSLPAHLQEALRPLLEEMASLTKKIDAYSNAAASNDIARPLRGRDFARGLEDSLWEGRSANTVQQVFTVGEIELDQRQRIVRKNSCVVNLSRKQFDVLHYLIQHIDMPVAHAELLQAVWGPKHVEKIEYLRTIMRDLRLKIENEPSRPAYLLTHASVGYKLCRPGGAAE